MTPDPTTSTGTADEQSLLVKKGGALAPAPTVSGGQVGANMTGGGKIGDPEVTNDRAGNGTPFTPRVLDLSPPDKDSQPKKQEGAAKDAAES